MDTRQQFGSTRTNGHWGNGEGTRADGRVRICSKDQGMWDLTQGQRYREGITRLAQVGKVAEGKGFDQEFCQRCC